MKNTKFLKSLKEFSEEFNQSYEISKFKLNQSYSESILLVTTIAGSNGGDCWGGRTHEYDVSDSEIQDGLSSNLKYAVNSLKDFFNPNVNYEEYTKNFTSYGSIDSITDNYDYYGNYTKNGLYEIKLYDFMKDNLTDDLYQIFSSYWSNQKNILNTNFNTEKTNEEIKVLENKIKTFDDLKKKELQTLKNSLENYKSMISSLEEKIANFETIKSIELKNLQKSLAKINKL